MLKQRFVLWAVTLIVALTPAAATVAQTPVEALPEECWTHPSFPYGQVGKAASEDYEYSKWHVAVIDGPCPVPCPSIGNAIAYKSGFYELACNVGDALCTGILYGVTATDEVETDLVGILARGPIPPFFSEGVVFEECEGQDSPLELGVNSCHEQLIKYSVGGGEKGFEGGSSYDFAFAVVGEGNRDVSTTTVAVADDLGDAYYDVEYCAIKGLGRQIPDSCVPACGNFNANQTITKTEVLDFKGCKIEFVFDLTTGAVLSAGLYQEEPLPPDCKFSEFEIGDLEVGIPGTNDPEQRKATFGQALLSAGQESCSCRVIGGRVYCWGLNCPQ